MTGRGVPDGDMPISLRPDQGDVPQLGDPAFDALLARALPPEEAVGSLRPVVESFAALYAAPVQSAPAAEASALTAFRSLAVPGAGRAVPHGRADPHGRAGRRRAAQHRTSRWVRFRLAGVRFAAAAGAIALTAGGAAAAAYAGDLPAPMQRLAHTVIGAPPVADGAPRPQPSAPGTSPVPGNAAYGLCQAYQRALAHGDLGHSSVTFRRLAKIAGGASQVKAYCAQLAHPGNPVSAHPSQPPQGKPSVLPTQHGNPTPASSHHGKPSALPTPAASHHGKPTSNAGRSAAK